MFTPLNRSVVKTIKENGKIDLLISPGWQREGSLKIPHSIVYVRNNGPMYNSVYLYYCNIISGRTIAVENMETSRNILSRPMAYLFLEMTVDAIESLATNTMSHKLSISSTVPGFAEIAFDKGFQVDWLEDKNIFRAIKEL